MAGARLQAVDDQGSKTRFRILSVCGGQNRPRLAIGQMG